jgi:hypothetical protein
VRGGREREEGLADGASVEKDVFGNIEIIGL